MIITRREWDGRLVYHVIWWHFPRSLVIPYSYSLTMDGMFPPNPLSYSNHGMNCEVTSHDNLASVIDEMSNNIWWEKREPANNKVIFIADFPNNVLYYVREYISLFSDESYVGVSKRDLHGDKNPSYLYNSKWVSSSSGLGRKDRFLCFEDALRMLETFNV